MSFHSFQEELKKRTTAEFEKKFAAETQNNTKAKVEGREEEREAKKRQRNVDIHIQSILYISHFLGLRSRTPHSP